MTLRRLSSVVLRRPRPNCCSQTNAGLGRAQHHDGIELRQIEPLVEHVDGADDVELARLSELFEGVRARGGGRPGVDGDGSHAVAVEVVGHEVGVALRDAERRACACRRACRSCSRAFLARVVAATARGQFLLVELVLRQGMLV